MNMEKASMELPLTANRDSVAQASGFTLPTAAATKAPRASTQIIENLSLIKNQDVKIDIDIHG